MATHHALQPMLLFQHHLAALSASLHGSVGSPAMMGSQHAPVTNPNIPLISGTPSPAPSLSHPLSMNLHDRLVHRSITSRSNTNSGGTLVLAYPELRPPISLCGTRRLPGPPGIPIPMPNSPSPPPSGAASPKAITANTINSDNPTVDQGNQGKDSRSSIRPRSSSPAGVLSSTKNMSIADLRLKARRHLASLGI